MFDLNKYPKVKASLKNTAIVSGSLIVVSFLGQKTLRDGLGVQTNSLKQTLKFAVLSTAVAAGLGYAQEEGFIGPLPQ